MTMAVRIVVNEGSIKKRIASRPNRNSERGPVSQAHSGAKAHFWCLIGAFVKLMRDFYGNRRYSRSR
jgi:hypothetical protein